MKPTILVLTAFILASCSGSGGSLQNDCASLIISNHGVIEINGDTSTGDGNHLLIQYEPSDDSLYEYQWGVDHAGCQLNVVSLRS